MWLVFLLIFFLVGIFYSKIELEIRHIFLSPKEFNFEIKLLFKLWNILPVFKVPLKQIRIQEGNKKLLINFKNIKFEKIFFTLKIGLDDIFLTNTVIVVIASILPLFFHDKVRRKNIKYEILPEYDKVQVHLLGKIRMSIKTSLLLRNYLKNIKSKIVHNKDKNDEVKESL